MIAHVYGEVAEKFIGSVIIDVNGVGYEVQVPAGEYDALQLHDTAKLYTHHHVREQAEELYGFSTLAGKRLFELLITVQGVGPKAALAILSLGSSEAVRSAIAAGDGAYIQGASGVGKRTADRVVVDLKDKVGISGGTHITELRPQKDDALEAMMALGYTLRQATEALDGIDQSLSVEEKIRTALKRLARQ
ncbi:MAG TPA: Holliday junction branch migration protein RuvA [Verrucomicrobiae bacterium]|nr:Holliday junction branch migration protein RuvA [Verrucomicrobiae bacterium]